MGILGPDCSGWAGARVLETTVTAACPWPVCLLVTFPVEKTSDPEAGQRLAAHPPTPAPLEMPPGYLSQDSPLVGQAPLVCGLPVLQGRRGLGSAVVSLLTADWHLLQNPFQAFYRASASISHF